MKSKLFYLSVTLALAFSAIVLSLTRLQASADASITNSSSNWIDDFDSSSLDSRWNWIREDSSHWSLTDHSGYMRITTQTGGIYGNYYAPEPNILLTDAPVQDFQITTKVTITPTQDHQTAGILYYQDDDNYLNLVHVHDYGVWVSFHAEVDGNASYVYYPQEVLTPTLYLRMVRQNTIFTGYYSEDGSNWTEIGQHTIVLVNPKIGVAACNGYPGIAEIPADFDFFDTQLIFRNFLPVIVR